MKILVTGSTGFVGSHLVDQLVSEGHEVFSLVRNLNKAREFEVKGELINGSLNPSEKNEWVDQLPSDLEAVVHTAGIVHATDTDDFYKVNTHSTNQLGIDLAVRYKNLKFILISSLAAAGPSSSLINEEALENPISEYGKSKLAAEKIVIDHFPKAWLKTIIRPPMVIGPRDPAVLDVFKMVKSGFVPGVGLKSSLKTYSFVCVFDLINTISLSLKDENKKTEVYFSSFPKEVRFEQLLESISTQLKSRKPFIIPLPTSLVKLTSKILPYIAPEARLTTDKLKEITPSAWICSSSKSVLNLGQTYIWDLHKTIEVTLKDYRSRGWL